MAARPEMKQIEQVRPDGYSDEAKAYFAHYGLEGGAAVEHRFGTFESGGLVLAGHLYRPQACVGTVVCLHGYLNHAGQFKHLIRFLTEQGYGAAVFDLPGHGLSGGRTAAIDSFSEYAAALESFLAVVKQYLPGPYHAIGFSTGCAILIDGLLEGRADEFEKIVLAAPLVHWNLYEQSKRTYAIYSRFTDKIPRFHQNNSSDRDYLVFNKTQDYLHASHLSLDWVKALFDWNEKIERLAPCPRPVLICQGDRDSTVDWKYNLGLLGRQLPGGRVEMIPGGRHELFNESLEIRRKVMYCILNHLQEKEPSGKSCHDHP